MLKQTESKKMNFIQILCFTPNKNYLKFYSKLKDSNI